MTLPKSARDLKRLLDEKDADLVRLTAERAALWAAYSEAAYRESMWNTDQMLERRQEHGQFVRDYWAGLSPDVKAERIARAVETRRVRYATRRAA